ncbi:cytochrome P450 [Xylariaceae sp. FL0594]|nr:cytochrome P450 [Xylariaceae sp. FL0594]
MWSQLAAAVGVVIATYVFFHALLHVTHDSREPPLVATSIPYIRPILGMLRQSSRYHNYLRDKYSVPIFTLRLPFTRLYIATSASLIPAVQRQYRTLSFYPVQNRVIAKLASLSKEAIRLVTEDVDDDVGFIPGFFKALYPTLTGTMLDTLNQRTANVMVSEFDKFAVGGPTVITYATTDGIYGPYNPLRDPDILAAYRVYEAKAMTLVVGILPTIFASEAIKAREFLWKKYYAFFAQNCHLEGSDYIIRHYAYMLKRGLGRVDAAKLEMSSLFPLISNTIPTAFWLIYRIFSSTAVLEDCRREVSRAVSEKNGIFLIDASVIKDSCPILLSTYQEVLRFHSMATSVRVALEDHLLDGKYLIKKGGIVMIPGPVQHSSAAIWGDDVAEFKHTRFVKSANTKHYNPNPVAFRGFGGGMTLCPGRHFATTEILLFATLLMLRFDVRPRLANEATKWPMPPTDKSTLASAMEQPGHDIDIELVPLLPQQKRRVVFTNNTHHNRTELVAEDIPSK